MSIGNTMFRQSARVFSLGCFREYGSRRNWRGKRKGKKQSDYGVCRVPKVLGGRIISNTVSERWYQTPLWVSLNRLLYGVLKASLERSGDGDSYKFLMDLQTEA